MRAYLKVLDREFQGVVDTIANQPESKSFFAAKVKEYPAEVRIEGDCEGLLPGMTAQVEILIASLDDVLTVPVSAVITKRGKFFAFVQAPEGPQQRELLLGLSNDSFVEVKDGLNEGDEVLLNPRAAVPEEVSDDEEDDEENEGDATARFGKTSSKGPTTGDRTSNGAGAGQPESSRSTDASADGAPGGRSGQQRSFSDLDKNGDGKITSDEAPWPGMIEKIDKDGDGAISASEFAKRPKRSPQGGNGGPGGGGR